MRSERTDRSAGQATLVCVKRVICNLLRNLLAEPVHSSTKTQSTEGTGTSDQREGGKGCGKSEHWLMWQIPRGNYQIARISALPTPFVKVSFSLVYMHHPKSGFSDMHHLRMDFALPFELAEVMPLNSLFCTRIYFALVLVLHIELEDEE